MMFTKKSKTECSGIEWSRFLYFLERLKKDDEYQFLLFTALGGYCGLRIGDILSLRWADVLDQDEFELMEGKTGKYRKITINASLREVISFIYQKEAEKKSVELQCKIFLNRSGNPLSRQYVNRKLHQLFHKYKIKAQNASSHTLRKSFGKRVYEMSENSEAALVLLSAIFNHSSTAITRKYIGLSQTQIENVYLNL